MPTLQGFPEKQNFMCSCTLNDIVKAFGACNSTNSQTCRDAYKCQRNDRISVPLLSFEMEITDIVLSNMLSGIQNQLYVFPWDGQTLLGSEPEIKLPTGKDLKRFSGSPVECSRKLSNILFAVLCRESLKVDLSKIFAFCNEALRVSNFSVSFEFSFMFVSGHSSHQ